MIVRQLKLVWDQLGEKRFSTTSPLGEGGSRALRITAKPSVIRWGKVPTARPEQDRGTSTTMSIVQGNHAIDYPVLPASSNGMLLFQLSETVLASNFYDWGVTGYSCMIQLGKVCRPLGSNRIAVQVEFGLAGRHTLPLFRGRAIDGRQL